MTLRLTFGVLRWTLEDTDLRWHVSCQSPSDKLSLWSRIFLYFVCAQILGSLLQVSSTFLLLLKKRFMSMGGKNGFKNLNILSDNREPKTMIQRYHSEKDPKKDKNVAQYT